MDYAPVVLTFPNATVTLSRVANIVTAIVSYQPGNQSGFQAIPAAFQPVGGDHTFVNTGDYTAPGTVTLQVSVVTGDAGIGIGGYNSPPTVPGSFTAQWMASPPGPTPDGYVLNPQEEQDSITAYLRTAYPHIPVIEDGVVDGDYSEIQYLEDGTVKPFIVLWYSQLKRNPRARSFSNYKLDSHSSTVDVVVVGRSGTVAREILNDVADSLVGFRTTGGGRLYKGAALWGDSRQVIDDKNRPSRWARTDRFDYGVQAIKIAP